MNPDIVLHSLKCMPQNFQKPETQTIEHPPLLKIITFYTMLSTGISILNEKFLSEFLLFK